MVAGARDAEQWWSVVGRRAWTVVGVAVVAALAGFALAQVRIVVIPLILGLFLAAALHPVTRRLRARRTPPAIASLASILLLLLVLAGVLVGLVPLVMRELPNLIETLGEGVRSADELLRREPLGLGIRDLDDLVEQGVERVTRDGTAEEALTTATSALVGAAVGLVLLFVATFFYLKDGDRFAEAVAGLVPAQHRHHAREIGVRTWETLGGYLRGQLIVAVFDAVLIGLGLVLLGVPLALPLATLVLIGGLFPIVGAVVSGAVAVLVALADGGLGLALATLALVLGVQQVESNVLQPFVLGRVVALPPFVVLLSVTLGAILLGVFGAFVAVPAAASAARAVEYLRARDQPASASEVKPAAPAGSVAS